MRAVLLAVIAMLAPALRAEDTLILRYNERPPFQVMLPDGTLGGRVGGLATRVFADAGIGVDTRLTPASRQAALLLANREASCMLGWASTSERLAQGKFSAVLYHAQRLIGVARADAAALSDGMTLGAALRNAQLRLLLKEGYLYSSAIHAALQRNQTVQLRTTSEAPAMLRMLLLGRADYSLMSEEEADFVIDQQGLPRAQLKFIHFADVVAPFERRLWCTQSVPDAIMARLDAAIKRHAARHPALVRWPAAKKDVHLALPSEPVGGPRVE